MAFNMLTLTKCSIVYLYILLDLSQYVIYCKVATKSEIKKKILLWYPQKCKNCYPYDTFGTSNAIFKRYNCSFTNCFIHRNHQKLPRIQNATAYDAIIFNGRLIGRLYSKQLPKERLPSQIYIFVQLLSPDRHPMCDSHYDDFFNWTMTYRLDSDVPWTYFQVKTLDNKTIGPSSHVQWMKQEEMVGIDSKLKMNLLKKTKIALYSLSNCDKTTGKMKNQREEYIKLLNDSLWRLTRKYMDTNSKCGPYENDTKKLQESLGRDYFFYIADEYSDDRDYVTNKLLAALQNDTLPIVFGTADYSRFLPPGSYIDAKTITPKDLAKLMVTLVRKRSKYYNYFKWRNHYYFADNYDLSGVACKLCAKLNQEKNPQSHKYFRYWWDNDYATKCSIKEATVLPEKYTKITSRKQSVPSKTTKIIMLWTPPNCTDCAPFKVFKRGNQIFKEQNCEYTNCYIRPMEINTRVFPPDAIMFNGRTITRTNEEDLPQKRSADQIYIFVQLESAKRYPVCQNYYDDFFNWTMTYRLNSDIPWTYFKVKTINNEIIGPKKGIHWLKSHDILEPIDEELKYQLKQKTKLVAWFVSYCRPVRNWVVDTLNQELKRLESELVDIYGDCGNLTCFRNDTEKCNDIIKEDYMFYLAFENSRDKDYVTEKMITAYQNDAVPVVLGDANYENFAPPDSYLNVRAMGPKLLARRMVEMYNNRSDYFELFRWRNHYTFEDNYHHAGGVACDLCAKLNTDQTVSTYGTFRGWWNERWWRFCRT